MIKRNQYLSKLISFIDTPLIKVITGMRRSGKSTLLALFRESLLQRGISEKKIISINFESFAFVEINDFRAFYDYVKSKIPSSGRVYILLDEVQMVSQWEKAVNSFRVDFDADIYITGSNAYLLSSELTTLLSGRYVEIKMLPLSFKEYLDFNDYKENSDKAPYFNRFIQYGGMPTISTLPDDPEIIRTYLSGIYNTVIMKDVINRNQVRDGALLERIMIYMADNIGNPVTTKRISDYLIGTGHKTTSDTVDSYLKMLESAYILYRADRYDTKSKSLLKTQAKYYIVDTGLRNELLGFGNSDFGRVYENIVFFELLRRGYRVTVGKVDNLEVDFIASRMDSFVYFQVTASVTDPAVRERELRPLLMLGDNYKKVILSMDTYPYATDDRGIRLKNIVDFLMEDDE